MKEADDLYAVAPEEFTKARNELAGRLKEEGRAEEAAEVKALRKPTLALWAVNQAARRHGSDMARVVELGDEVRAAQVEGRALDFRAAARERSAALAQVLERVRSILEGAGGSASHAARAGRTIEAAAADEEARDALLAGALRHELEPGGFGDVFGLLPEAPPPDPAAAKQAAAAESARANAQTLVERARDARRDALRLEREADEAEGRALSARRAAQRAAKAADEAEDEAERASRRADDLLG